jgi:hypothetical protein
VANIGEQAIAGSVFHGNRRFQLKALSASWRTDHFGMKSATAYHHERWQQAKNTLNQH